MSQTTELSEGFKEFEREFCQQFEFLFRDYGFHGTWRGDSPGGMAVWCLGLDSDLVQARIEVLDGERGAGIAIGPPSAEFRHTDCFDSYPLWLNLYTAMNLIREQRGLNPIWPPTCGEYRNRNPLTQAHISELPVLLEPIFDDILEIVKRSLECTQPSVVTRIQMKPESAGWRHAPFTEGYSPQIVVPGHAGWLGVRVIQCPGLVAPGDEAEVVFALIYHPHLDYSALQVGTTFHMMEGPRAIATGRVLKIEHEHTTA